MNCPKCGNTLAPNTKFCAKCGTPVAQQPPEQPGPAQPMSAQQKVITQKPAQPKQKKKNKNLPLIIVAIVLVIAVIASSIAVVPKVIKNNTEINNATEYIEDFPTLKQQTQFLVYDAEKFPSEKYEIKVERMLMGGIFNGAFKGETVIEDVSTDPVYNIDFKEDGDYRITLTDITAARTQATSEQTEATSENSAEIIEIVIIIDVVVDNDAEDAVDKVNINAEVVEDVTTEPTQSDEEDVPDEEPTVGPLKAYGSVLNMYYKSILCKWKNADGQNSDEVTDPDSVSSMFGYILNSYSIDQIGYAFINIDGKGQEELIISSDSLAGEGRFHSIYTWSKYGIVLLAVGNERYTHTLTEDNSIISLAYGGHLSYSYTKRFLDTATAELKTDKVIINDGVTADEWFYFDRTMGDEVTEENRKPISAQEAESMINAISKGQAIELTYFSDFTLLGGYGSNDSNDILADAVEFNGHYYKMYDSSMTWQEAKAECESLGGHLVTVTSQEEQEFAQTLIENGQKKQYWLGLDTDDGWVTGESLSYTNWDAIEPNHHTRSDGQVETYVHILRISNPNVSGSRAYAWNDMYNDNTFPSEEDNFSLNTVGFICEWE